MIRHLNQRHRLGFTLIELLVVMGVISIVISLTLPAIRSAKEAANRTQCINNLRQLGIATQNYHDINGSYQPAITNLTNNNYGGYFSIFSRLLPQLEQQNIFNSINFAVGTWPTDSFQVALGYPQVSINSINSTTYNVKISNFLCPSDEGSLSDSGVNYRGNVGVGPEYGTSAEQPDSGNGIFPEIGPIRISQISDGLSHTIAYSERSRGSGLSSGLNPSRDAFGMSQLVFTADDLLKACQIAAHSVNTQGNTNLGKHWFFSGRENTLYNHSQSPNGTIPDCVNGSALTAGDMATARSYHASGVNVGMCDGSTRFIPNSVTLPVWRALGTRNGGEIVD